MVRISPQASNLIALVAENPATPQANVDQLLSNLTDSSQRDLVSRVVTVIRQRSQNAGAQIADSEAVEIAEAYLLWAAENAGARAAEQRREERRPATVG